MATLEVTDSAQDRKYLFLATLAALGVVFGDIGTSPLYAMRECFWGAHGIPATSENVLGVLSLIFWSLVIIVSIKYLVIVMRADNRGEGGVLALMALAHPRGKTNTRQQHLIIGMGLFGAALLYGDGMLTPAISVLSAVEGLSHATDFFEPIVLPITLMILIGVFILQSRGTHKIGSFFGPILCLWFVSIGVLGLQSIIATPAVLRGLNPWYAIEYFLLHGIHGLPILGSVFLALTGAEALYADMGHFGRRPIRIAWFTIAFPGLLLNYFGQGALLLRDPSAAENPFYNLAPPFLLYPMVLLATIAAVIASQAVITGAFSITRQAVQLGYLPRVNILHTSSDEIGQIYVPIVNWMLLLSTILLVVSFKSSDALASAYGIAVSTTMIITSFLTFFVAQRVWKLHPIISYLVIGSILIVDLVFFSANMLKLFHGGWVPLLIAILLYFLMSTWKKGRELLGDRLKSALITPERFIKQVAPTFPHRLPGTAIFMARSVDLIPAALFHNVKHNQVLHETVVLASVRTEEIPHVPLPGRVEVEERGSGFWSVTIHYGFMDTPNIPEAMRQCAEHGLKIDPLSVTYFLSRETLIATPIPGMAEWREHLFAFMTRNAQRAANFFKIPSNQVVELGIQIEL